MQNKGARKRAFFITPVLSFRAKQDHSRANGPAKSRNLLFVLDKRLISVIAPGRKQQVPPRVIGLAKPIQSLGRDDSLLVDSIAGREHVGNVGFALAVSGVRKTGANVLFCEIRKLTQISE